MPTDRGRMFQREYPASIFIQATACYLNYATSTYEPHCGTDLDWLECPNKPSFSPVSLVPVLAPGLSSGTRSPGFWTGSLACLYPLRSRALTHHSPLWYCSASAQHEPEGEGCGRGAGQIARGRESSLIGWVALLLFCTACMPRSHARAHVCRGRGGACRGWWRERNHHSIFSLVLD